MVDIYKASLLLIENETSDVICYGDSGLFSILLLWIFFSLSFSPAIVSFYREVLISCR